MLVRVKDPSAIAWSRKRVQFATRQTRQKGKLTRRRVGLVRAIVIGARPRSVYSSCTASPSSYFAAVFSRSPTRERRFGRGPSLTRRAPQEHGPVQGLALAFSVR